MNKTQTAPVIQKFGPLTREEEAVVAPFTSDEKLRGSYFRSYSGLSLFKVGLGVSWHVGLSDGREYGARFHTVREAMAWIDSDMRLDWVSMWHRKN